MIKDTPMPQKLKNKPPKDHGIPVISFAVQTKLNTPDKGNKFQSFNNASSTKFGT